MSNASPGWRDTLESEGIARIRSPFPDETLERWNRALDPLFRARAREERSYVRADELQGYAILEELFRPEMRRLIAEAIPDSVLLHCHAYEIAPARSRSHVRGRELRGWHRDMPASGPGRQAPAFASVFLYLHEVGPGGAPFEAVRGCFEAPAKNGRPCVSLTGPAGTLFIWNRALLHRAAPNRGNSRRRLLKLSIQHNHGPNPAVESLPFRQVRERVAADAFLLHLFGGAHGKEAALPSLSDLDAHVPELIPLVDNATIDLDPMDVALGRILASARAVLAPFRTPPGY